MQAVWGLLRTKHRRGYLRPPPCWPGPEPPLSWCRGSAPARCCCPVPRSAPAACAGRHGSASTPPTSADCSSLGLLFVPLSLVARSRVREQDSGGGLQPAQHRAADRRLDRLAVLGTAAWTAVASSVRTQAAGATAAAARAGHPLHAGPGDQLPGGNRCGRSRKPWSSRNRPATTYGPVDGGGPGGTFVPDAATQDSTRRRTFG